MDSEKLFRKYMEHVGRLQRYLRGYFYEDIGIGIFSNATKKEYGYGAYEECVALHTIGEIFVEASLGEKQNELADFDDFLWDMAEGNKEKERIYHMYEVLKYPCSEIPPYGVFTYEKFVVAVERKEMAIKMAVEQDEHYDFKTDIEKYLKDMYDAWRGWGFEERNYEAMRKIAEAWIEVAKLQGWVKGTTAENKMDYVAVNVESIYNGARKAYREGKDMVAWIDENRRLFVEMAVCLNGMQEKVAGAKRVEGIFNTLVMWAREGYIDTLSGEVVAKDGKVIDWVAEEWDAVADIYKEECKEVLRGD